VNLMVEPFFGEFGWQLMRWQGYVRSEAKKYKKVVVCCETGYEYLYQDITSEIWHYDKPKGMVRDMCRGLFKDREVSLCDGWGISDPKPTIHNSNILCPGKWLSNPYCELTQEFIRFGRSVQRLNIVLFHARNAQYSYRNWPLSKWIELNNKINVETASVGTRTESLYIPGTTDLRGIPLNQLADLMRKSAVLVTPSSGIAHFASLCELPHVVWSDSRRWAMGLTNEYRYKVAWNPFHTHCTFITHEQWQPDVESVYQAICQYLS